MITPVDHDTHPKPPLATTTSGSTTASSIPSSQSNGSLHNLTSNKEQMTPPHRPLVNRTSNPIISTESDDDGEGVGGSADSLDEHLKAATGGQDDEQLKMNMSKETATTAGTTRGSATVSANNATTTSSVNNNMNAIEMARPLPPDSVNFRAATNHLSTIAGPSGNINYDAVNSNINTVATTDSIEMPFHTSGSMMNGTASSSTPNNPKKLSPLSSRVSVDSTSQQSSKYSQPKYMPPGLSTNPPFLAAITPNNTNVSMTPVSSLASPHTGITTFTSPSSPKSKEGTNDSAAFNFDASQHHRKRGTGYLASQLSLSTPTDVFASGCTLLQLAAIGNLQAVKEYISTTFGNVNFRDYDRRTALHVAASEGHLDVVKYLVNKGANVNRSDRWGGSPLDDAHRHRHTDVARYLRSKGAKTGSLNLTTNLIAAAAAGDMEEVTMICADVFNNGRTLDLSGSRRKEFPGPKDDCNSMGMGGNRSILDLSSSKGRVTRGKQNSMDVSEPALTGGGKCAVDVNKGDYDKRTALHLAAGEGHLDVVQFLCKRGANVNVEDRWGGRPLDDALQRGHENVAEVLRKYGATSAHDGGVAASHRTSTAGSMILSSSDHVVSEDENFRVDFGELEMIERIGSGAFGEIYKCRWRGILVAAKCIKASKIQKEWLLKNRSHVAKKDRIKNRVDAIKQTTITEDEKQLALEDFRRETAIMRRLRHPNIVMMLAYSHSDDVEVMISEICRCSLLDIFKANNISNSQLPKRTQIAYAQQLAQGMNHLHKSRPPIIHRDLKPANLLVDFNGTLKIADFGLAKIRPNPEQNENEAFMMTGETGSYRFMAPEVFRHEEYTETVDVYSYAMIFFYMLRGNPPWSGLSGLDAVTKAAVDGERPLIPRNVDERLSTLLKRCWDENPRARPSFEEIITSLNIYSHDIFKTNDKDAQSMMNLSTHDNRLKCACVIS